MSPTPAKRKKQIDVADHDEEGGRTKKASPRPDEMSAEVVEFITAVDEYKRTNQRPFPTWSEVLEILKGLGYQRTS